MSLVVGIIISIIVKNPIFVFFITIAGIIITSIISFKPTKNFTNAFKQTFILKALQSVFTDLNYQPNNGFDESVIRNTAMMKMGDRYSSNDFVSGKYKNVNVLQSDVHIEIETETTDSDGHDTTSWVTIFKGRWMIFFKKNQSFD